MSFDHGLFDRTPEAAIRRSAIARASLRKAFAKEKAKHLRPPPRMTVDEWADKYRVLPPGSPLPGPWRTSSFEVARGPLRAFTEPGVREITAPAATQLFKSELLLNAIGYIAHLDPAPVLLVQPSETMARAFSRERLTPLFSHSPALRSLLARPVARTASEASAKSRDATNTSLYKGFPGGFVALASAQSPTDLASRPARYVFLDEVGRYPLDNGEGSPQTQAERRTGNYASNSLICRVSSPAEKGSCPITQAYEQSDMRRPFVVCPHCDMRQVLRLPGIRWPKDADGNHLVEEAEYYCAGCGAAWSEVQRIDALQTVDWRQCKVFRCCGGEHDPEAIHMSGGRAWEHDGHVWRAICPTCGKRAVSNRHAGFWCSRLYSPAQSLAGVAREFLSAKGSSEQLRAFVNTILAEAWEPPAEKQDANSLLAKREPYSPDAIPLGVGLLVAGVDTQDNRLEVTLLGVGRDSEAWVIDHVILPGDTSEPDVWADLDAVLSRSYTRADGRQLMVQAACVDSGGHRNLVVSHWCQERKTRRIFAIRGKSEVPGKRHPLWTGRATFNTKSRTALYEIGTQTAKFFIADAYRLASGPRSLHFPLHLDDAYFAQLTAERLVEVSRGAMKSRMWKCPDGARNEALDCLVYAYAALEALRSAGVKPNEWVSASGAQAPIPSAPAPIPAPAATPEPPASTPAPSASAPRPTASRPSQPVRKPVVPPRAPGSSWMKPKRRW